MQGHVYKEKIFLLRFRRYCPLAYNFLWKSLSAMWTSFQVRKIALAFWFVRMHNICFSSELQSQLNLQINVLLQANNIAYCFSIVRPFEMWLLYRVVLICSGNSLWNSCIPSVSFCKSCTQPKIQNLYHLTNS